MLYNCPVDIEASLFPFDTHQHQVLTAADVGQTYRFHKKIVSLPPTLSTMAILRCQAGERRRHLLRLQLTESQGGRWRSSGKLATHFCMMCERDVAD